ncbi:MAG TPA: SRPBCC family protein [Chloroflexia bacterium]|nr:SRPBCC family protein [Chloroflexia bacterium]
MARMHAEASAVINAGPDVVYNIIADYENGHPRILPEKYFSNLQIEEGGVGAGTVISFSMKVGGSETTYRARIEEPEPGRVLVEKGLNSDTTTTFTVTPAEGGKSLVKIATDWTGSSGIKGLIERAAAPGMLRKVYEEELRKLEEVTASREAQQK